MSMRYRVHYAALLPFQETIVVCNKSFPLRQTGKGQIPEVKLGTTLEIESGSI